MVRVAGSPASRKVSGISVLRLRCNFARDRLLQAGGFFAHDHD
jgi:hypothetical protein